MMGAIFMKFGRAPMTQRTPKGSGAVVIGLELQRDRQRLIPAALDCACFSVVVSERRRRRDLALSCCPDARSRRGRRFYRMPKSGGRSVFQPAAVWLHDRQVLFVLPWLIAARRRSHNGPSAPRERACGRGLGVGWLLCTFLQTEVGPRQRLNISSFG
jgi:hypothetical protein